MKFIWKISQNSSRFQVLGSRNSTLNFELLYEVITHLVRSVQHACVIYLAICVILYSSPAVK